MPRRARILNETRGTVLAERADLATSTWSHVTTSADFGIWPFLRASRLRFGVGASVLSLWAMG